MKGQRLALCVALSAALLGSSTVHGQQTPLTTVRILQPSGNSFSEHFGGSLPIPLTQHGGTGVPAEGKLYVYGGANSNYDGNANPFSNQIFVYDIASGTWSEDPPWKMPYGIIGQGSECAETPSGKIAISPGIGPYSSGGWGSHNRLMILDPSTGVVSEDATYPFARVWACQLVTAANNQVYSFGGWTGGGVADIFRYDEPSHSLVRVAALAGGGTQVSDAVLADNGKIYLIGGNQGSGRETLINIFDPATNSCVLSRKTLPFQCEQSGIRAWYLGGDVIYIADTWPGPTSIWKYRISTDSFDPSPSPFAFSSAQDHHTITAGDKGSSKMYVIGGVGEEQLPLFTVREIAGTQRIYRRGQAEPYIVKGVVKNSLEWTPPGIWGPLGSEYNDSDLRHIAAWGANTVRLPLNQTYWLWSQSESYKAIVRKVVADANALGLNVILDLHWTSGNTVDTSLVGLYPMPDDRYSRSFWRQVATEFRTNERVFFELFNEPHEYQVEGAPEFKTLDWSVWRSGGRIDKGNLYQRGSNLWLSADAYQAIGMQQLVDLVRDTVKAENLILVPGTSWASDISGILSTPLIGDNIAYTIHAYKGSLAPRDWSRRFGSVAERFPVIATEYGQYDCCSDYVSEFLRYTASNQIGVTGWAWYWQRPKCSGKDKYSPCVHPSLIKNWDGEPTAMGYPTKMYLMTGNVPDDINCDCYDYVKPSEDAACICNWLKFSVYSPVALQITDPAGRTCSGRRNEIPDTRIEFSPIAEGDTSTSIIVEYPEQGLYSISLYAKAGAELTDTYDLVVTHHYDTLLLIRSGLISAIPLQGFVISTLDTGSVSGALAVSGTGLLGVPVDLYDTDGNLTASDVTDADGRYGFYGLNNGKYTVSIATPLGYQADQETKEIVVRGLRQAVDFNLTKQNVAVAPRGLGYWMHQVAALLPGKGQSQESRDAMCCYMEQIRTHFNENRLNPVDIFRVDLNADCTRRLAALGYVLSPRAAMSLNDKAKMHLTVLLLNIASGKIPQWAKISADSATASQAITFCNSLIVDPEPKNDEMAKNIAEMINEGQMVPAGWINPTTPDIAYKQQVVAPIPSSFALGQNSPNPFNAGTVINYSLDRGGRARVEVYDVLGRHVRTLVDEVQLAGRHDVTWDGTDAQGKPAASGMYFYRLAAGGQVDSKKMVLLK